MSLPMICRICKRNYVGTEYKRTGTLYGLCSEGCRTIRDENSTPSPVSEKIVAELNKVSE